MKKVLLTIAITIFAIGGFLAWQIFGPTVKPPEGKYFYIHTGSDYATVKNGLAAEGITSSKFFDLLAKQSGYNKKVLAGRYEVKSGTSVYNLLKMLKRGYQTPVNFVVTKLRTPQDLAGRIGRYFETDSATAINHLTNLDSLKSLGVDTNLLMTIVIPNTYSLKWNTPFPKIMERLKAEKEKFWTDERIAKAKAKNLSPNQIYTIASIVEEETNHQPEKGEVASVYMNRVRLGMKLQADPTVKFAMKDFGLKRILYSHLTYPSPYNTYYAAGFPPGPICTPSTKTIDAVLDAPETNYIFFVANPKFDGTHLFASSYAEHQLNAKKYQKALDSLIIAKRNAGKP